MRMTIVPVGETFVGVGICRAVSVLVSTALECLLEVLLGRTILCLGLLVIVVLLRGGRLCLYLHRVHFCDLRVHCLVHHRDLHHVLVAERTVVVAVCWGCADWLEILGLLAMLEIVAGCLTGLPGHVDMLA